MYSFKYHNPTKIIFGQGNIASISKEIPKGARVLITYGGGSIKTNGIYDQVIMALQDHCCFEFSGIEPNPKYNTLKVGIDLIKELNIDYLLAVGGGSVIDGTKFMAAAALYEGDDPWDILANRQRINEALPIGAVLTLPATGSENNGGFVVTRNGHKLASSSPLVRPEFAVLDPAASLSLSKRQVSNGVVDAFVHIMEQYLTFPVNAKVQDRFAEGLLLTLVEDGPLALESDHEEDIDIRANIMWSASMALSGLIGAGVPQDWATHMIGHELTASFGTDHARTLSILLLAVMKVCRQQKREKLLQYAERIWDLQLGSEEQRIDQAIAATEEFFILMGMPVRLIEIGVDKRNVDEIIERLEHHGMTALGENRDVNLGVSRTILEMAL